MRLQGCDRKGRGILTITLCLALLVTAGCASSRARRHLEKVAKGWCETIRASQVIPVYPLTEDLMPGDVFLVQTPIGSQARIYRKRGFLALDDHRTRLKKLNYGTLYSDGYWKDEFGQVPHPRVARTNAGAIATNGSIALTEVSAPRVAFPTYSFAAKSGFGLSLALPIKGVPVGLNFLRTDRVNGSVTIADARTYAADELELYRMLEKWTELPAVRQILSETVANATDRPVYLRVVTRVYLTGAVIVSLIRAEASGAGLKAGSAPKLDLVDASGNVNTNYQKILDTLNTQSNPVTALKDAGGAVKFVGASESSVALAESFDRLLVIGYLGFDVPVYPGGAIGAPIPTFQRLDGQIPDFRRTVVGPLTVQQASFKVNEAALEALAAKEPAKALIVMGSVLRQLDASEFNEARKAHRAASRSAGRTGGDKAFQELLRAFKEAAAEYVSIGGSQGARYAHYDEAFARAYDERDGKNK